MSSDPFSPLSNASNIVTCPWDSNMTWNDHRVTENALHNLTFVCPFFVNHSYPELEKNLENPATFFVQVTRLFLILILLIPIAFIYNSVTVLGKTVLSVAMCSFYWIIMFFLLALKALVFIILVPAVSKADSGAELNKAGFVSLIVLQCGADLALLLALDHEQRFRSSDFATLVSSPYSHTCIPVTFRGVFCSWYRVPALVSVVIPLTLLTAVEITFQLSHTPPHAPSPLVWTFIFSLYLPRLCAILLIVKIFLLKDTLQPTILAKVFLVAGFLFSFTDHLPSSVTTVAPYAHHNVSSLNADCHDPCQLDVMTVFDLFQLLGGVSVLFYALFIRSQYLRIENECKLAMVWDMQRLLNVNGRHDVVAS